MNPASRYLVAAAVALSASACVTINIYFPAAAAEKAADRIIDEVWQLREAAPEATGAPAAPDTQGGTK
ncbi:hypothetical protein [Thauera sp. AutoDN2]|uniref:hypothetical protein n=1 Tax=Thauera sp. AutoDN2 TaxID=3416051 RepID=UPI003F4C4E50